MKKNVKKHIKLIIGFIIGISITTGIYATTLINSNAVNYDNTASELTSTNAQDALDELKTKIDNCK